MIWYLFSHRRHGVAAQEWMIKMQTITKLRVNDQRLHETGVKVISGFEEYGTLRQGSVAEDEVPRDTTTTLRFCCGLTHVFTLVGIGNIKPD